MKYLRGFSFLYRVSLLVQVRVQVQWLWKAYKYVFKSQLSELLNVVVKFYHRIVREL